MKLRKSDVALESRNLAKLTAAAPAHEVHHVDPDPQDGTAVRRFVEVPIRARAGLIRLLAADLGYLAYEPLVHRLFQSEIGWGIANRQQLSELPVVTCYGLTNLIKGGASDRERLLCNHIQFPLRTSDDSVGPFPIVIADRDQVEFFFIEHLTVVAVLLRGTQPGVPGSACTRLFVC